MTIRTVIARNMAEALALVRRHLGVDARILHTRTIRRGGVLGIGGREMVEVTAAIESPRASPAPRRKANTPRRSAAARKAVAASPDRRGLSDSGALGSVVAPARVAPESPAARLSAYERAYGSPASTATPDPRERPSRRPEGLDTSGPAGDLIRRTYQAAKAELDKKRAAQAAADAQAMSAKGPRIARVAPPADDREALRQELASVRKLVEASLRQQHRVPPPSALASDPRDSAVCGEADGLVGFYRQMIEQEVARELADEVLAEVRSSLGRDGVDDEAACRAAVRAALAERFEVDASAGELRKGVDGRPRTIALVGPTGVGKTTSLAKLAATFVLKQGAKVGLITLDTYRIAAVDQLRTYAELIGAELAVVRDAGEMRMALA
ncbi:MAG: flagellar biosynthesis protein FlhF, partial [Planctomycetota bacterium]